jgi:uncharacterized protein (UPF0262 family)
VSAKPLAFRISEIELDERSLVNRGPAVEREREVAIYDLLEHNHFAPRGSRGGPYRLLLSLTENRLVFDIRLKDGSEHGKVILSLTAFKKIVKDYFLVCESYYDAIRSAPPARIEAIDMGRRGLHDEGSRLLMQRLDGKVAVDFDTARRLFTLMCALQLKA